ncbi:hypothetical protein ACFQH6_08970 [Halobacteriaceae archaeon GCM10025711]
MPSADDPLVAFVRRRTGDLLRGVARYDDEGVELLYLREDIPREEARSRAREMYENLTGSTAESGRLRDELGHQYASLQLREGGVVLRLRSGLGRGVVISLESAAARRLDTFVRECMRFVAAPNPVR